MKKILITGKNSYIGNSFKEWIEKNDWNYQVDSISVRDSEWLQVDFSKYDSILHVAGIAHVSKDKSREELYYQVNRDLAIKVANKAKRDGVKQFVFMSSIIIYGAIDTMIGEGRIGPETIPAPADFYGQSKLEADLAIHKLNGQNFKTVIVRTPVVYGPGCKGNFTRLVTLAQRSKVFPSIKNKRSMIYIDNLSEFIRMQIEHETNGVFFPQNREYVSTTDMVKSLAVLCNNKIFLTRIFTLPLKLASNKFFFINKVFGNKVYDKNLTKDFSYCVVDFNESLKRSISKK